MTTGNMCHVMESFEIKQVLENCKTPPFLQWSRCLLGVRVCERLDFKPRRFQTNKIGQLLSAM